MSGNNVFNNDYNTTITLFETFTKMNSINMQTFLFNIPTTSAIFVGNKCKYFVDTISKTRL